MNLETAAVLAFVVAGWLDFAGVMYMWRNGSHLMVPVGTWHLPRRLHEELERGSLHGFRVTPLADDRYLLRPVLWFEKAASAAPFLIGVATARSEAASVNVRVYAPLAGLLLALLIPTWVIGPPRSAATFVAFVAVGAAVLASVVATHRSAFDACFKRLERAWAIAPENNKMQQTSHG
jgi:hypothetical protein